MQFQDGTTLERAHELAHELRNAIERELPNVEILIHVEPEASRRDPEDSEPFRAG
jgi:divalent metal cation (Fe/Co/Zn/Cd) transporter